MTTKEKAPDWIMNQLLGGAYDAATALLLSDLHRILLHTEELIAKGELGTGEPFDSNRQRLAAENAALLGELKAHHDQLEPHDYEEGENPL